MKKFLLVLIIFIISCSTVSVPTNPPQYMSDDELKREYWAALNAYTSLERTHYNYMWQGGGLLSSVMRNKAGSDLQKVQNRLTEIRTEMSIRGISP